MKYVVCRIGLVAAVLPFVFAVPARAEQPSRIVISEVSWAGSAQSTADEWIELANLNGTDVDVGGWIISGIASGGGAISLAEGTTIAAGETLLIANYAMGNSSTLTVPPKMVTTAVSIANRALNILLLMPDGTVVDSAIDAGDIEFGSSQTFATMERDLATMMWRTADTSTNLLHGQLGTPGTIVYAPPAEEAAPVVPAETPVEEELPVTTETPEPVEPSVPVETPAVEPPPAPTLSPELVIEETVVEEPVVEEIPVEIPVEETAEESEEVDDVPVEYVPVEEPVTETPVAEPAIPTPVEPAAPTIARTGKVQLSEFVSSPAEGDEWIELLNADTVPIDLTGWQVADASGKLTTISAVTLEPGAWYVITKPLGKLNNDADTITLYESSHQVVATLSYAKDTAPAAGESLAWNGSAWAVTSFITPGSANAFPPPEASAVPEVLNTTAEEEVDVYALSDTESLAGSTIQDDVTNSASTATEHDVAAPTRVTVVASAAPAAKSTKSSTGSTVKKSSRTSSKKSSSKSASAAARTVSTLDDIAAEERVQFTGTLIALPGTFGSQIAVLNGAMVYMHSADWPALQVGDVVRVEGVVSVSRGEKRIKITAADLTVTGHTELLSGVLSNRTPSLVNVRGRVLGRDGDSITLDVNGEKITVRANDASGVTWSGMTTTTVVVTGILRSIDGERVLMPRSTDDVQFLQEETLSTAPAATTGSFNARPWIGSGLLVSSAAALGYWFIRSRQQHTLVTA